MRGGREEGKEVSPKCTLRATIIFLVGEGTSVLEISLYIKR